jgi:hypothetical protein
MADDVNRDPDVISRCPPYSRQSRQSFVSETRFLSSPHLNILLLSHEHMDEVLRGERVVTAPPRGSPSAQWLTSGDREDFEGPILISWVFFRHMSLRDNQGAYTYRPQFYVRVAADGIVPFSMHMPSEWHERANTTMALPACGRSVHHVTLRRILPTLLRRGQRETLTLPEWEFEVLCHEFIIHRHCVRASKSLVGTAFYDDRDRAPNSDPDFGSPSS